MTYYGEITYPANLDFALSWRRIGPGDTIWLRGGTYSGDYTCVLNGTAEAPILVKPYQNEHVVIDGSLTINGSHTHWYGIEIMYSGWQTRLSEQAGSDPSDIPDKSLTINAPGCKVINCVIHNLSGVGSWMPAVGTEFYGNVLYHIGWKGPDRGHGHLLYAQNQTERKLCKHNIMLDNFGWGFHIYSTNAYIDNFDLIQNTVFRAGSLDSGQHTNILLGGENVPANDCVMDGNLSYGAGAGLQGYASGFRNLALRNNHLPNGIAKDTDDTYSEDTNNIVGSVGNAVYVYPNTYQADRANVTVFNEAQTDSVTVDLSSVSGLAAGDTVTVRNVQDYFVDIQTLTLDAGKIITVNMQAENRTVAAPVGWNAPATTFPTFGCFVVERV